MYEGAELDFSMQQSGTENQGVCRKNMHVFSDQDEPLPYPGWGIEGDYEWLYMRGLHSN